MADLAGPAVSVDPRRVDLGHFLGLSHEGGGRVGYLYEATLKGRTPRRGLVLLDAGQSSIG